MSGKQKPGRGHSLDEQLQADLAAARQQLRELHEAIKDSREILRDITDAHRNAAKSLEQFGRELVGECRETVYSRLEELTVRLAKSMPVRIACPKCGNVQTVIVSPEETFCCLGCKAQFHMGLPPDSPYIGPQETSAYHASPSIYVTDDPALAPPGSVVIDGR